MSGADDKQLENWGEDLLWCRIVGTFSIEDGIMPTVLKASPVSKFIIWEDDIGADTELRLLRSGTGGRLTEYCW